MRKTLIGLTAMLMTTASAFAADMTDSEREAFRAEVRAYLLEEPEVLLDAMDVYRAKEETQAAQRDIEMLQVNADAIFNDPNSWSGGNPDGDVTVVEFMDYHCSFCQKAFPEVEKLVTTDGNIRFVLKELPVLGPESVRASQFALAVRQLYGDDAYKAAHDKLSFPRGKWSDENLARLATDLGHDPAAVTARMDAPEVMDVLKANHELATTLGIEGTPGFVINDTMVRGYVPVAGLRAIVAGQRAK